MRNPNTEIKPVIKEKTLELLMQKNGTRKKKPKKLDQLLILMIMKKQN